MEDGAENFLTEVTPLIDEGLEDAGVGCAVLAESGGGRCEAVFEHDGCTVVEGMGERGWRLDPFQAEFLKREGLEEGAGDSHGEDGRA
jgi:hypothetical protein